MSILKAKLTEEQQTVFEECKRALNKYGQAAVLLSTGGGKSYIAAHVFAYLKRTNPKFKTLWITIVLSKTLVLTML